MADKQIETPNPVGLTPRLTLEAMVQTQTLRACISPEAPDCLAPGRYRFGNGVLKVSQNKDSPSNRRFRTQERLRRKLAKKQMAAKG